MSRTRLAVLLGLAATSSLVISCSKSAANQDTGGKPMADQGAQKVMVPGGEGEGAPRMTIEGAGTGERAGATKGGRASDVFRLKPEEGKLAIELPADVKAGAESIAKILVTPGGPYKINTEFPTKLTLETPTGLTLAKAQLTAGGHDKAKGDAEAFDEKQVAFNVKLTPSASGAYTINGTFKFAVCDKDSCLAKKEPISITVAAN